MNTFSLVLIWEPDLEDLVFSSSGFAYTWDEFVRQCIACNGKYKLFGNVWDSLETTDVSEIIYLLLQCEFLFKQEMKANEKASKGTSTMIPPITT